MHDFGMVMDNSHFWEFPAQDAVGVYEVARLVLPKQPPYIVDIVWQVLVNEDSTVSQLILTPDILWQLRMDQLSTDGAPNYVGPGFLPREVTGNPLVGGWPDRAYISDNWWTAQGMHYILNGPIMLRLFATVNVIPGGITHIGGRLRAREYPSKG